MEPTDDGHAQSDQTRKGLTGSLSGPARAETCLLTSHVRRFHLRLLTVLPFRQTEDGSWRQDQIKILVYDALKIRRHDRGGAIFHYNGRPPKTRTGS